MHISGRIVLDHINRIVMDSASPPLANAHALDFLPAGLFSLAMTINALEEQKNSENGGIEVFEMLGNMPAIVPCAFHWFSTSAVNYVKLVGLIDLMQKNGWTSDDLAIKANWSAIKSHCSTYEETVVPSIHKWRNKVTAHFAATDPHKDDNLGMLEQCVMNSVSFHSKRYWAGSFDFVVKGDSWNLPDWSVTEIYENLAKRYWPNSVLSRNQKIAVAPTYTVLPLST